MSDLAALVSSTRARSNWTPWTMAEEDIVGRLTRQAVLERLPGQRRPGRAGDRPSPSSTTARRSRWATTCLRRLTSRRCAGTPACGRQRAKLAGSESAVALAAATELILEGLHLSKRLNKYPNGRGGASYRARRS